MAVHTLCCLFPHRWRGLQSGDYTYAFNPCNAFSESGDCSDAHVCQNQDSTSYQQNIGDKGTEQIYYDTVETDTKRQIYVYYTGPGIAEPREVFVYLICDKGDTNVTALGEPETLRYEFEVRGKIACFGGAASVAAGLAGLILMLLLIVGFALYCVIGAVIMKVKFEKTGSEIIPNKHFWTELPLMLKDGVLFTFSPCVSAVQKKKGTYSSL